MLLKIRERSQGWIAWLIVGLISIPFALWGINSYLGVDPNIAVATIDGNDIGLIEFDRHFQQQQQRLRDRLGSQYDSSKIDVNRFRREVLDKLVRDQLLMIEGTRLGMRIGDDQVAAQINSVEGFRENGQFSKSLYVQRLRLQGLDPESFQAQLRRSMLLDQLRRAITSSVIVTDDELDQAIRLRDQHRDIGYMTIPVSQFTDAVTVTDADIEDWYKGNLASYTTPELVSVEYLELSLQQLAEQVEVTDDALQAYYDSHRDNYRVEEERRAHHILIRNLDASEPDGEAKALEKINSLNDMLAAGKSFEDLAREYSDDPGSAPQGGDLGFFGRGVMDPAFEELVFSLQPGETGGPVKSSFGYHLIRVDEIRGAQEKPFAEARSEVEADFRRNEAEQVFYDLADRLAALAFENPDNLTIAAEELGLTIKRTDMFSRSGGSGIAANRRVVDAAFSTDVLDAGNNSEVLELSNNDLIVLRVDEHVESGQRGLDEVRAEIRKTLVANRARQKTADKGRALIERLRNGESGADVAASASLEWKTAENIARDDRELARPLVRAAFRAGRPQAGKAAVTGVPMGNGDYSVVAVSKVTDGDPASLSAADRQAVRQQLQQFYGASEFDEFVNSIRANANIEIHEERL